MKTTAVRIYGKNDLRMESFELPRIKEEDTIKVLWIENGGMACTT